MLYFFMSTPSLCRKQSGGGRSTDFQLFFVGGVLKSYFFILNYNPLFKDNADYTVD